MIEVEQYRANDLVKPISRYLADLWSSHLFQREPFEILVITVRDTKWQRDVKVEES